MTKSSILKNLDWWTIFIYVALVFIGWINIYASIYDSDHGNILDMSQRYGMQMIWIGAAFTLAFVMLLLDTNVYNVFSIPIYVFTLCILAAVLVIGVEVNGSKSWLAFGPVRFQPAELAKVATALALARVMSEYGFKISKKSSILQIGLIFALPIGLILLQKDTGSAMVFASFAIMLYREGMNGWIVITALFMVVLFIASLMFESTEIIITIALLSFAVYIFANKQIWKPLKALLFLAVAIIVAIFVNNEAELGFAVYKIILTCCAVFSAVLLILNRKKISRVFFVILFFFASVFVSLSVDYVFDNFLKPHQKDRIDNLLGKKIDLQGAGYNVHQSMVAIGSGGISGKGFLQGTQTKFNFVPEQSTDFIFCTVGEEWGFIGSLIVIGLYVFMLIRIIIIAERQKYAFSRIYAYCVAGILFFHFAANIGMTIGLMPVIGIPLPFLSYGGSSLWAFTILLFIMLKLDTNR